MTTNTQNGLNINSKGTLAKLLATENIQICQDPSVKTASFDLASRTLTLPVYDRLAGSTVDTLVGHEVGHALFTPNDGWNKFLDVNAANNDEARKLAHHFINVCEDSRVDRRIKSRYPGLALDYKTGWAELHNRHDIFGVKGMSPADIAELPLIDRINLHTKIGVHAGVHIPFNAAEQAIVDKVMSTATFDDAAEIAGKLYQDYVKDREFPPNQQQQQQQGKGKGKPQSGQGQGQSKPSKGQGEGQGQGQGKGQGSGAGESQEDAQTKPRDGQGQGGESEDQPKNEQEQNDSENQSQPKNDPQNDKSEDSQDESEDQGENESEDNNEPSEDESEDQGEDESESDSDADGDEEDNEYVNGGRNNCTERPQAQTVTPNNTGRAGTTPGSMMNYAKNRLETMAGSGQKPVLNTVPEINVKAVVKTTEWMRKNFASDVIVLGKSVYGRSTSAAVAPSNGACGWYHTTHQSLFCQLREEFSKTHGGAINAMVQEFNRYKAADEYKRTGTAKTGVINTNKMVHYKYSEDIFRRITTSRSGKNHGLVMLVDWSGSMDGNMYDTMMQLVILTEFCRKVGIPFDVYAFSDVAGAAVDCHAAIKTAKDRNLIVAPFGLVHLISSKDARNNQSVNRDIMLGIAEAYRHPYHENKEMMGSGCIAQIGGRRTIVTGIARLGGTPLNSAIIAMFQIVPEFKAHHKLQVVHTVVLTDGDATDDIRGNEYVNGKWQYRSMTGGYNWKNAMLHHKPSRRYQTGDWNPSSGVTATLLQLLEGAAETNTTCIFIGGTPTHHARDDKERKQVTDDGFYAANNRNGFTNYFVVPSNTLASTVKAPQNTFQSFTFDPSKKQSEKMLQDRFAKAMEANKASKNIFRALGRAMSVNNYDPTKRRRSVVV